MKYFKKLKAENGRVYIRFFGIKIFTWQGKFDVYKAFKQTQNELIQIKTEIVPSSVRIAPIAAKQGAQSILNNKNAYPQISGFTVLSNRHLTKIAMAASSSVPAIVPRVPTIFSLAIRLVIVETTNSHSSPNPSGINNTPIARPMSANIELSGAATSKPHV